MKLSGLQSFYVSASIFVNLTLIHVVQMFVRGGHTVFHVKKVATAQHAFIKKMTWYGDHWDMTISPPLMNPQVFWEGMVNAQMAWPWSFGRVDDALPGMPLWWTPSHHLMLHPHPSCLAQQLRQQPRENCLNTPQSANTHFHSSCFGNHGTYQHRRYMLLIWTRRLANFCFWWPQRVVVLISTTVCTCVTV